MRAIDVMTPSVICAQPDMTVQDAAKRLVDNGISGMPVVDESGALVGIVSEGDLLRRVETSTQSKNPWWLEMLSSTRELAATFVKEHGRLVGDVMSAEVITVDEQASLVDIADTMERRSIKRVPVLRDGKLVGIVSRSNLIRALASVPPPVQDAQGVQEGEGGTPISDSEIAEAIVAALHGKRWSLPKENVIVVDGVAHLWGMIQSDEEERALCIAAGEVKGVKKVQPHLAFPTVMPLM